MHEPEAIKTPIASTAPSLSLSSQSLPLAPEPRIARAGAAVRNLIVLLSIVLMPQATRAQTVSTCTAGQYVPIGPYQIYPNDWNAGTISGYSNCVSADLTSSALQAQLQWNWPNPTGYPNYNEVKAFPEVIFGWSPWLNYSTTPELPIQLSAINDITISLNASVSASGDWDFIFNSWVTTTGTVSSNPGSIAAEIVIWLGSSGMTPAGSIIDTVEIDGQQYNVWQAHMTSPVPPTSWDYVAFQSVNEQFDTILNSGRSPSIL